MFLTYRVISTRVSKDQGWCPAVTPASYLHLLQEFFGLFSARQQHTTTIKKKYLSGLEKLEFASSQVICVFCMLNSKQNNKTFMEKIFYASSVKISFISIDKFRKNPYGYYNKIL